jgi:HD-GYP domain-containing protein (c-di-GMP phosphodiesterase class II)
MQPPDAWPGNSGDVQGASSSDGGQVRAAEVVAALSLATDFGIGLPLEHGLHSTLVAMRLGERLGIDAETASQTYYACLLFYIGCTADAEVSAELFDDGALLAHFNPVMFGAPAQTMAGIARALAEWEGGLPVRALHVVSRLPRALGGHQRHLVALCEVAQMLTDRLGLPPAVRGLFADLTERWDGKGEPAGLRGEEIPLPLRIVHVARDAAFQRLLGGSEYAARVVRERAGHAFDPSIAALLADEARDLLSLDANASAWEETLTREPLPQLILRGGAVDQALAAMGDFTDLLSPYLVGHSAEVAELAAAASRRCGLPAADLVTVRRAALVHDLGRVAIPTRIWQKAAPLTPGEWEQVRLHAYHSERILCRSPFLASLAPVATCHHERLDGTGYHRGAMAVSLPPAARLLAAADAYHAMTEPRPYRQALSSKRAAEALGQEARDGRLDADSVAAVLEAAGHAAPRVTRPAGLSDREAQVITLLARGFQTKQIARALGISVKTADHHVQNAYAKIGISTRAAAALFAMEHGLATWGEVPIVGPRSRF